MKFYSTITKLAEVVASIEGTVNFQGPAEAANEFEALFAAALYAAKPPLNKEPSPRFDAVAAKDATFEIQDRPRLNGRTRGMRLIGYRD